MTAPSVDPDQAPEVGALGRSGRNAVVQLFLRTSALRVITLIGMAVLARLLLPEDFGVFAVVMFLVGLAAPFGELGLGARLIQQPERPTETEMATAFTIQQAAWLGLFALIWIAAPLVREHVPGMPADVDAMLRVTGLALLVGAQKALPAAMMTRVLRFGPLASIEVLQQSVYFGTAVALAWSGAGPWSFVAGLLAQAVIGTLLTFVAWGRRPPIGFDGATARRLLGFGVPYQASSTIAAMREMMVPLFGGLAGGVAAIGFLQVGQRMGRLVGGIDDVIGRVAFPAFSRLHAQPARLERALLYAVETAGLVLGLILGWTVAVAPTLIVLAFSERWAPAVPVFQLTAIAALAGVPAMFLRGLAFAAGENRRVLAWTVAAIAVALVSFPVLLLAFGLPGGGLAFLIHALTLLFGYHRATRHLAPFPWTRLGRIYALAATAGLSAALVLAALPGVAGLIVSALVYLVAYGLLLVVFERDQLLRAWQLLVRGAAVDSG